MCVIYCPKNCLLQNPETATSDGAYSNEENHSYLEKKGIGKIAYPGALYPVKFDELEKYKAGGFFIIEFDNVLKSRFVKIESHKVVALKLSSH